MVGQITFVVLFSLMRPMSKEPVLSYLEWTMIFSTRLTNRILGPLAFQAMSRRQNPLRGDDWSSAGVKEESTEPGGCNLVAKPDLSVHPNSLPYRSIWWTTPLSLGYLPVCLRVFPSLFYHLLFLIEICHGQAPGAATLPPTTRCVGDNPQKPARKVKCNLWFPPFPTIHNTLLSSFLFIPYHHLCLLLAWLTAKKRITSLVRTFRNGFTRSWRGVPLFEGDGLTEVQTSVPFFGVVGQDSEHLELAFSEIPDYVVDEKYQIEVVEYNELNWFRQLHRPPSERRSFFITVNMRERCPVGRSSASPSFRSSSRSFRTLFATMTMASSSSLASGILFTGLSFFVVVVTSRSEKLPLPLHSLCLSIFICILASGNR